MLWGRVELGGEQLGSIQQTDPEFLLLTVPAGSELRRICYFAEGSLLTRTMPGIK